MSRKTAQNPYGDLNTSSTNPHLKQALARIDLGEGKSEWRRYRSTSDSLYPPESSPTLLRGYENWENFNGCWPISNLLVTHKELFGFVPPKKSLVKENVSIAIYAKWCAMAREVMSEATKAVLVPKDPESGRKSTIGLRRYFLGKVSDVALIKTPQALACYKILVDAIGTGESVSEADFKAQIIKRSAELKTKQDPWRIFQYYRPRLLETHHIKHD